MSKKKVGIIGCGNISPIYFEAEGKFNNLEIAACADIVVEKAKERAAEYGVARACTPDELLADADIDIVVNLTLQAAHADIHYRALNAGKHTYGEKPLATSLSDGRRILKLAASKKLRVGTAPDTFLGGSLQTCRKLIDDGWIGEPIAASAFMVSPGPEMFHPSPAFLYDDGAGPLFDMGPYYFSALIHLLGPVKRVSGMATRSSAERIILIGEQYGSKIPVNTDTHISGTLEFESGVVATTIMSFDVPGSRLPDIEIYGTQGTLSIPHPNFFGGIVRLKRHNHSDFSDIPLTHGYINNYRGLGLNDMIQAISEGRQHRANGEMAYHILEIMHGLVRSGRERRHIDLESSCDRPAPLPAFSLENNKI